MKKIATGSRLAAGAVLAAGIVLGAAGTAGAIDWGKKELSNEQISVKVARETVKGGYQLVLTDELKGWVDAKKPMLVVDTMPGKDGYDKRHIPGAVQYEFPIEEMKEMPADRQADYAKLLGDDKGRLIVVYCGFPRCGRSHNGAVWAMKLGYTNVVRYVGGIKAWEEADHPVEKAR